MSNIYFTWNFSDVLEAWMDELLGRKLKDYFLRCYCQWKGNLHSTFRILRRWGNFCQISISACCALEKCSRGFSETVSKIEILNLNFWINCNPECCFIATVIIDIHCELYDEWVPQLSNSVERNEWNSWNFCFLRIIITSSTESN